MTTVCSSGEYQRSETLAMGSSLPISPAGMVMVDCVPSACTPSIICLPSDSVFASGCASFPANAGGAAATAIPPLLISAPPGGGTLALKVNILSLAPAAPATAPDALVLLKKKTPLPMGSL